MSALKKLWVEKYQPSDVEDYLFQDKAQSNAFLKMIINQEIPHLLLSGIQGTGKTSLARLLIAEVGLGVEDVLEINASEKTSVDIVRDEIMPFISQMTSAPYRIVFLEEADALSPAAQKSLKYTLEEYSDVVRFIFTTNFEHKLQAAIKSRLQQFRFKSHSQAQVEALITKILTAEGIKFSPEVVSKYVAVCNPDIRKTIHLVQQYSSSGTLVDVSVTAENSEYKYRLLEHIETDAWFNIVHGVLPIIPYEEWDDAYRFLYENAHRSPKLAGDVANMKTAIVCIAEYMYRHPICSDPAINAAALMIRLDEI